MNRRVGLLYVGGAAVLGGLSLAFRPWSLMLLWPAFSMVIVACGYFGAGARIYGKRAGRLPIFRRLLLWPVLLGQRLSLMHYARQCRPWDRLTERVWIGRALSEAEARHAVAEGVTAVLDLTCEFTEAKAFRDCAYRSIPILDLTAPTAAELDAAVEFIHQHSTNGSVYVHCKAGYSRTAAVAGAYLLAAGHATSSDAAFVMLRAARPSIIIRPEAAAAVRGYEARHASISINSK